MIVPFGPRNTVAFVVVSGQPPPLLYPAPITRLISTVISQQCLHIGGRCQPHAARPADLDERHEAIALVDIVDGLAARPVFAEAAALEGQRVAAPGRWAVLPLYISIVFIEEVESLEKLMYRWTFDLILRVCDDIFDIFF